jgi:hypothetical protein
LLQRDVATVLTLCQRCFFCSLLQRDAASVSTLSTVVFYLWLQLDLASASTFFANGGFLFIVATGCSPFSTLCQRCLLFTAATGGYSGPFFSISISFATSAVHFVSMLSVDIMQMGQFSAWFNLQAVCHHLFNFMVLITHGADLDSRLSYFSMKAMIICTSKLLMFFVRCYF